MLWQKLLMAIGVGIVGFGLGWYLGRRSVKPAVVTRYDTLQIVHYDTVTVRNFVYIQDTIRDTVKDIRYIVNHDTVYISAQTELQFLTYCEVKPGTKRAEWIRVDTRGVSHLQKKYSHPIFGVGGFTSENGVVNGFPYFIGLVGKVTIGIAPSAGAGIYVGHKNWLFMGLISNELRTGRYGLAIEAVKFFSPILEF